MIDDNTLLIMTYKDLLYQWMEWKSSKIGVTYQKKNLALDTGIHAAQLSRYFKGKQIPNDTNKERIARALGITVSQFWEGPPNNQTEKIEVQSGENADMQNNGADALKGKICTKVCALPDDKLQRVSDFVDGLSEREKNIEKIS